MSEEANNEEKTGALGSGSIPIRLRNRFPKAMPNVATTSGLNRIRRLSGHVSAPSSTPQTQTTANSELNENIEDKTPSIQSTSIHLPAASPLNKIQM